MGGGASSTQTQKGMKKWIFLLWASALYAEDTSHHPVLPSDLLNEQLPKWIRVSMQHRFRFEEYQALRFRADNNDHWLLNRLRLNLTLKPTKWWTFNFQAQDARIFFKENPSGAAPYVNRTDLRLAYTDFGEIGKSRLALRFGRQELAYGEERVLGAANWGNVARTFDAVKLVLRQGPSQLDLFSASVTKPQIRGLSHHLEGNNLHGAYLHLEKLIPRAIGEPYFLWRLGPSSRGPLDLKTTGLRIAGKLPAHFDYSTEFIAQTGSIGTSRMGANATHLVLYRALSPVSHYKPRWFTEYNHATGDRDPNDQKISTFDQLYPTPHDKTGLADQVGWQNIHHLATGIDFTPWRHWILRGSVQDWYLDQARDGIYLTNGTLVFRDPTGRSGRHVGEETDVTAIYTAGAQSIGLGYGHIFAGDFLRHVSPGHGLNYAYLNVGYRF
jgi:hypothetical protein